MRVLLTDGSGLTARQTAAQLADAGHTVGVLSPDPVCLARFTRRVRHVWRVPPYGPDPLRWLDAMLSVYQSAGTDVLVPTQEQVAVLSACDDLVRAAGVRTAVPSFEALSQVQDKLSAFATLTAAGLPQPEGAILATPADVAAWDRFPVFMKDQGITVFSVPVLSLVIMVVLAGVAGLVAAILPSRRAAKLNILRAITSE